MAELHIRNIPLDLHEQLRRQAQERGRSMSAEAIHLLRTELQQQPSPDLTARRLAAIERLKEIRERNPLSPGAPTAEELVREDRDSW